MTTVRELDAIVRTGERLDDAITDLSDAALRALADRWDANLNRNRYANEIFVRRHVIGLHRFKPTGRRND